MSDAISHVDDGHRGTFFIESDGARIAEMSYWHGKGRIVIDHTHSECKTLNKTGYFARPA